MSLNPSKKDPTALSIGEELCVPATCAALVTERAGTAGGGSSCNAACVQQASSRGWSGAVAVSGGVAQACPHLYI